ncbi:MAG: hypothetical protein ACE5H3_01985 [Planctomycetota bacterium]
MQKPVQAICHLLLTNTTSAKHPDSRAVLFGAAIAGMAGESIASSMTDAAADQAAHFFSKLMMKSSSPRISLPGEAVILLEDHPLVKKILGQRRGIPEKFLVTFPRNP